MFGILWIFMDIFRFFCFESKLSTGFLVLSPDSRSAVCAAIGICQWRQVDDRPASASHEDEYRPWASEGASRPGTCPYVPFDEVSASHLIRFVLMYGFRIRAYSISYDTLPSVSAMNLRRLRFPKLRLARSSIMTLLSITISR